MVSMTRYLVFLSTVLKVSVTTFLLIVFSVVACIQFAGMDRTQLLFKIFIAHVYITMEIPTLIIQRPTFITDTMRGVPTTNPDTI